MAQSFNGLHVQVVCGFIQNIEVGAGRENTCSEMVENEFLRHKEKRIILFWARRQAPQCPNRLTTAWSSERRPPGSSGPQISSPQGAWPALQRCHSGPTDDGIPLQVALEKTSTSDELLIQLICYFLGSPPQSPCSYTQTEGDFSRLIQDRPGCKGQLRHSLTADRTLNIPGNFRARSSTALTFKSSCSTWCWLK